MADRLYRSRRDRIIGGVCGGLGAYFAIDPVIVRLVFVILAIWGGIGVLLYLVLWILMPPEERMGAISQDVIDANVAELRQEAHEFARQTRQMFTGETSGESPVPRDRTILAAAILIIFGVVLLLSNIFGVSLHHLWPLVLIALGIYLLYQAAVRR